MSPNMIGGIIGLIVGFMGFVVIRMVAARVESQRIGAEPQQAAKILRWVAAIDMIIFTVVGYFVGPMIVSGAGN